MTPKDTQRSPLQAFLHHQGRAAEETGKAIASLLPRPFREHLSSAVDEGRAGWEALFDGAIDRVQNSLDRVRRRPKASAEDKVKIKVE